MRTTLLYINEELIDLNPSAVIAKTIQVFDVKDITKRKVSHTNSFKVPPTKNNLRKLGYLDNVHSRTSVPYQTNPAKVIQNGIELINGTAFIKQTNGGDIEIAIFDSAIDLFDQIKGGSLSTLGFLDNGPFDDAGIDSYVTATSGIFSPAVDWGRMTDSLVEPDFYLPSFFYKEIILAILESTGLTLAGNILTNELFSSLIIPYSRENWIYPDEFIDEHSFIATAVPGTIPSYNAISSISAAWTFDDGQTPDFFDIATSHIKIPAFYSGASPEFTEMNVTVRFSFLAFSLTGDAGKFELIHRRSGVDTVLDTYAFTMPGAPATNGDVVLSYENLNMANQDEVYLQYTPTTGTPTVEVEDYSYEVVNTGKIFDSWVFFNYLLPTETMDEFIKDFFIRFGIIDKQIGNTLHLKTLEEIISDRAGAVDWSAKRVPEQNVKDNIDFDLGYGQENVFSYEDNTGDGLGNGSIDIANDSLDPSVDLFPSMFGNSEYINHDFINCALLPAFDVDSVTRADMSGIGLRLLATRDRKSIEQSLGFGGSGRTDYQVGLFEQPNETTGAGFQRFIDAHYDRFGKSIQKLKIVTRYYRLSDMDVKSFDKHKMIYDDGYFLVLKINNHISGKNTKVELLKVL